jgi:hypothetical protein
MFAINFVKGVIKKSLNRRQRLKLKKKSQQDDEEMDFKDFTDTVKFGEVAHQPPNLKVRPRGSDKLTSSRVTLPPSSVSF